MQHGRVRGRLVQFNVVQECRRPLRGRCSEFAEHADHVKLENALAHYRVCRRSADLKAQRQHCVDRFRRPILVVIVGNSETPQREG